MKDKIMSVTFIVFLTLMLIINIIDKDNLVSISERRKLEKLPNLTINNILNKTYMEDLDTYLLDQFILRDTFRQIKAKVNYDIFMKLENNRIYLYNNHIFKSEYPTNYKSIDNFIDKINSINKYLTPNNKSYFAIIPDKNYYAETNKCLNIDYNYLYERIKEINYNYIELRDILTLDDYYRTDTHWKQENLCKVVNRIGKYLNFYDTCNYDIKTYDNFYGVYYGQSALNKKPDTLTYITNKEILNSEVYYLENKHNNKVYNEEYLKNLDSYDIFLSGASSYIEIKNKYNTNSKELIIFRDSFASSLAPLLIKQYSKITLIDTRYINSDIYLEKIKFNNQDVLFLYSTLIINNSYTLKN